VAQLDQAVEAAAVAYKSWSVTPYEERVACLQKFAKEIMGNAKELAALLVLEQGKPMAAAMGEVGGCAAWASVTSTFKVENQVVEEDENHKVEIQKLPLGVIGLITPWNFPAMLAMWKICPATLAGNTVVLKPSPYTPLTSLALAEIANKVFPPGVINVVSGGNELGAKLVEHPGVAKISFTGSTPTGKGIMQTAAKDLKRVTLELGGNDAAIVMADVDPKAAAPAIFQGAFANSGQVCSAIKRVFVHESKYDQFVDAITEETKKHTFGSGMKEGTDFGPLNNKMQFDKVSEYVEDARANGAKITVGGNPTGEGYIYPATIIANVNDDTRIVKEEQFGPALPILSYSTTEEVIERANNTKFGLSGSVWGNDIEAATAIANQIDAGTVWVNQHLAIAPHLPFGGRKWSGIGREGGDYGMSHFSEPRVISIIKKPAFSKL
jgi:acyl-CoA reductase-like NAD-dependent aldehyde dehydrogenase